MKKHIVYIYGRECRENSVSSCVQHWYDSTLQMGLVGESNGNSVGACRVGMYPTSSNMESPRGAKCAQVLRRTLLVRHTYVYGISPVSPWLLASFSHPNIRHKT